LEALDAASKTYSLADRAAELADLGQTLYRWLDGDARQLTGLIDQGHWGNLRTVVLAIDAPMLADQPWELLHDGKGYLVERFPRAILPARWFADGSVSSETENRALEILFMAASVHEDLDFEAEEDAIEAAVARTDSLLLVEETGTLAELRLRLADLPGRPDVLHLSGHGRADVGFDFENDEGGSMPATAGEIVDSLSQLPRLLFLSGCETAKATPATPALAYGLAEAGVQNVLGWARSVSDPSATHAATELYRLLSEGEDLPRALAFAYASLRQEGDPEWHLLRWFLRGERPAPFVTRRNTPGRAARALPPADPMFLGSGPDKVPVASKREFVGYRRLLQRGVRTLRNPDAQRAGLVLRGFGGRGKSSIAARLADRLDDELQPIVVVGELDEAKLIGRLVEDLSASEDLELVKSMYDGRPLLARLRELFKVRPKPRLIILDDFERNQPRAVEGDWVVEGPPGHASVPAECLRALIDAVRGSRNRILLTTRYSLPDTFEAQFDVEDVPPMAWRDIVKLARRNAEFADGRRLREVAEAAGFNPRLLRSLWAVVNDPCLPGEDVLRRVREGANEFLKSQILADALLDALPPSARTLLEVMSGFALPVPEAILPVVEPDLPAQWPDDLKRLVGLTLVDRFPGSVVEVAVSPLLAAARFPVSDHTDPARAGRAARALVSAWTTSALATEEQASEVMRLAKLASEVESWQRGAAALFAHQYHSDRWRETIAIASKNEDWVAGHPNLAARYAVALRITGDAAGASALLEQTFRACPEVLDAGWVLLASEVADLREARGDLDEALRIRREVQLPVYERLGNVRSAAVTWGKIADVVGARGDLDEALRIRREMCLPAFERLGDVRSAAVTWGQIADVLGARGDLDEALRIRREMCLPAFERLGEVRETAVTWGKIADVLGARGDLDEALRILREMCLPAFERLGDVRSAAVTWGKIADVLGARGDLDEALRILREMCLPAFERLGDVRETAVTWGKIADVVGARGDLDEALRILREMCLPAFERLGDVRSAAVTWGKIADVLGARGDLDEALRIRREMCLPAFERLGEVRETAVTWGKIADVVGARGDLDEALRIRREMCLPAFERLGDVRSAAVTWGQIADVVEARGDLDEALRIRREVELPVYERLGDVRSAAVTWGQIADVLGARGDLDEALRIRREMCLPAFERLGDVRETAVTQVKLALTFVHRGKLDEDGVEVLHLLRSALATFRRLRLPEARQVEEIFRRLGIPVPEAEQ
jgi:tetratricopeptide (TPR) repeat protein